MNFLIAGNIFGKLVSARKASTITPSHPKIPLTQSTVSLYGLNTKPGDQHLTNNYTETQVGHVVGPSEVA